MLLKLKRKNMYRVVCRSYININIKYTIIISVPQSFHIMIPIFQNVIYANLQGFLLGQQS